MKRTALAVLLAASVTFLPTAALAERTFVLEGVEISQGETIKDCAAKTYVTRGIRLVGTSSPPGRWTARLNAEGLLDDACEPVVCTSPVQITSGIMILNAFIGLLVTRITGELGFRPGPLLSGICPVAPLSAEVDPLFRTGTLSGVTGGGVSGELDHNHIPATLDATLILSQ